MERNKKHLKKKPDQDRIKQNINTIRKMVTKSEPCFNKPIVKTITNTIVIGGTVFGTLYLSKYFFSATAKMIRSFKEVRDACKE
ncbi:hypothetical protein [Aquimarina sp. I32.4]|uniref:hypothetical protein n=1 Tax=Aquimarina sp. I32.4 TaxID=2053903 RepID=UPI000CDE6EE4|nr:hypothetical protein [Aquimarina sp. I32.4]